MSGTKSSDHVPQNTNPISTAKAAVNPRNHAVLGFSLTCQILLSAMMVKTIVNMATVSIMPSAPK